MKLGLDLKLWSGYDFEPKFLSLFILCFVIRRLEKKQNGAGGAEGESRPSDESVVGQERLTRGGEVLDG